MLSPEVAKPIWRPRMASHLSLMNAQLESGQPFMNERIFADFNMFYLRLPRKMT